MNQRSLIFQGVQLVSLVTSLYSDRINSGGKLGRIRKETFVTHFNGIITDCGVCSWIWQWFALGKCDRPMFVTTKRGTAVKNTLGWSAVVLCLLYNTVTFCGVPCCLSSAYILCHTLKEIYFSQDMYVFDQIPSSVLRAPACSTAVFLNLCETAAL